MEARQAGLCAPLRSGSPDTGDVAASSQCDDIEQIRVFFDDAQRVDADGARAAQEGDGAGKGVFPLGRRKFCYIAEHAFPSAKKGSPETSPVLAFRRRCVPRRLVFPCPCGQGRKSLLQGLGSVPSGLRKGAGIAFPPFLKLPALQKPPIRKMSQGPWRTRRSGSRTAGCPHGRGRRRVRAGRCPNP